MTVWGFGIASILMAIAMPLWSYPTEYFTMDMQLPGWLDQYSLPGWALILWIIILGTLAPYLFVIGGLRILSASTASVIGIKTECETECSGLAYPVTGSNQCSMSPTNNIAKPPKTDPNAKTIIGIVITAGDSCGCTSSFQRASPKNVIAIIRVI